MFYVKEISCSSNVHVSGEALTFLRETRQRKSFYLEDSSE